MKYTFHYKVMMFITFLLAGASIEFVLEHLIVPAAVFIGITFFILMGVLAAPDSEKYVKK
jgi:hypothetical protein